MESVVVSSLKLKRKFCSFLVAAAVVKIFMTSNLKVKNYMQETSGAWEGQSKRNWNTGLSVGREDMPGKSLNEGSGT